MPTVVSSTADLSPAGIAGYAKLVAAFLAGLLTVLVPFLPTDSGYDQWIQGGIAVLGFIAVYAIPNKVQPVTVVQPPQG
jgi:uncharacterized membrane protein